LFLPLSIALSVTRSPIQHYNRLSFSLKRTPSSPSASVLTTDATSEETGIETEATDEDSLDEFETIEFDTGTDEPRS